MSTAAIDLTALAPGQELARREHRLTRDTLVRYAGASGDFNPIHYNDAVATAAGLPGVIAHGMVTLALVARAVTEWAGGPGRIEELSARFTRPVVVPAERGATVRVGGEVRAIEDGIVTLGLVVTCGEETVLGNPRAVVRV